LDSIHNLHTSGHPNRLDGIETTTRNGRSETKTSQGCSRADSIRGLSYPCKAFLY